MINFRVADLEAIVEQLRDSGEQVNVDPERDPSGRFAELRDLEGHGIQLWQPMGPPPGLIAGQRSGGPLPLR
jgi:predicted enzyme related to lactoylglutathione lyase